jgi:hypothetical protein
VWCIASVIGLAELNCAVTSYLCAVSIILRINKRARHRSVNILAGQSSRGFHRFSFFYKNMPLPVHEFFPSIVWNEYNALCAGSFEGLFMIYRPSVRPSFRTPTGTNPFEQSSSEVSGHSHAQKMP